MRASARYARVVSVLVLLFWSSYCEGASFGVMPKELPVEVERFSNSTDSLSSTSTTKTSGIVSTTTSLSDYSSITPAATLSAAIASENSSSTITTAPEWGNQSIPINTCSTVNTTGVIQTIWTPCHVYAGTVQLSFFPEASGNVTYPSTYYDSSLSITLTSPSIYMIVNTITGDNDCGPLGPTYATKVIAMDPSDVYTLQPYADASATTRLGEPQVLTLSDLKDCTYTTTSTAHGASTTDQVRNSHPVNNTYNSCNPRLVFPVQLKRLGYPYWKHCGNNNYNIGLFDPPGAVPSVDSLFTAIPISAITTTSDSASAAPTAAADLASSTQVAQDQGTSTTLVASDPTTAVGQAATSQPTLAEVTTNPIGSSPVQTTAGEFLQTSDLMPTSPTDIVAVVGTNTISAIAGSPGVILGGTDSKTTFFANPTHPVVTQAQGSTVVVTIAGQTISAAAGDSTVVINGQTITSGGAEVTISGSENVVTLGSAGLVVKNSGGVVSTFAIPTATLDAQSGVTLAGFAITETAGASKVVIGSQTVTLGGDAITLANSDVVSVGSSGIVVQSPGGAVITVSLATAASGNVFAVASTTTNKVAVAIASIIGASSPSNGESSSTPNVTGEGTTAKYTGAANMLYGNSVTAWAAILVGLMFGV